MHWLLMLSEDRQETQKEETLQRLHSARLVFFQSKQKLAGLESAAQEQVTHYLGKNTILIKNIYRKSAT